MIIRWDVQPGRFDEFAAAWAEATDLIRASRTGALGSELCRVRGDPNKAIAIAHWQSRQHWADSVSLTETDPAVAGRMIEHAVVTSIDGCVVVDSRLAAPPR